MPLVSERDRSAVYVYAWVGLGLLKWKRSVCAGGCWEAKLCEGCRCSGRRGSESSIETESACADE